MRFKSEDPTQYTHILAEKGREIAYTEEFKEFIRANPGALKDFLRATEKVTVIGEQTQEGLVNLTCVHVVRDQYDITGRSDRFYYKANIGDHMFFVKASHPRSISGGGSEEFTGSRKAAEALKDTPGVEVVNYKFGYQDKHHVYFISDWNDALRDSLRMDRLMVSLTQSGQEDGELYKKLTKRLESISRKLPNHYDMHLGNMTYDPDKDIIYLFDLRAYDN